jgi:carboxymethylenebutenolidase
MEAYGLNDYVQAECRRLAERGYVALAPDFYHGETFSYDDRDGCLTKLQSLTDDALLTEIRASVAYLDQRSEALHDAYGAVGFCMGGRLAFLTAAELGARIGAAVSFYGGGIAPDQPRFFPPIAHRVPDLRAPITLFYGADDQSIPPSEHARLASALSEHKKSYTITVYPGAGHAFASKGRENYVREAAEDAWARALLFFDTTLRKDHKTA